MGVALINGHIVSDSGVNLANKADLVNGLVPSSQLPSYVDDVLEYANLAGFPTTGETGKIYVALDSNKIYRWSGSAYIEVSPSVGTTWGGITGTLSNQTDLQNALNAKQNSLSGTGFVRMSGTTVSYITGTSSQFVKADGSLDSSTYVTGGPYLSLSGGTMNGNILFANTTSPHTHYIQFGDNTGWIFRFMTNVLGTPTMRFSFKDNGDFTAVGALRGSSFIRDGGTSSQFLKADGSVDSTAYTTNTGTVTSIALATGTTGTDVNVSGSPITSSGTITLNIPTASGSARGLLSSTDWTTFNNKQAALNGTGFVRMSGTTVSYVTGSSSQFVKADGTLDSNTYLTSVSNITGTAQGSMRLHSGRDFPNGTLIETSIDYSVTNGDPFVLEITGNSYFSLIPFNVTYQGYIYNNTVISNGGTSIGTPITGMSLFNYNGKLCFWFPSLGYWQGFNVYTYIAQSGYKENKTTAISNVAKPAGITKEVSMSFQQVIRTSSGSNGTTNYLPKFTSGTVLGDSQVFDDGTRVGIGTNSTTYGFDVRKTSNVFGVNGTDSFIDIRGYNNGTSKIITNAGLSSSYNGVSIQSNNTNANSLPSWRVDIGGYDGISYGTDNFWIGRTPSGGSLSRFFFINSSGNIGIGTASPTARFSIVTSSAANDADTTVERHEVGADATLGSLYFMTTMRPSATGSNRRVEMYAGDNSAYRNIVFTYGNIGVGTTAPQTRFHVGGVTTSEISIGTVTYGGNSNQALASIQSDQSSGTSGGILYFKTNPWNNSSGSGVYSPITRMTITELGNVGIGTTTPSGNLQIGSISTSGNRTIRITDSGYGLLLSGGGGSSNNYISSIGTTIPLYFLAGNNNDGNYIFSSTGNVGIGTTSPTSKLDVNGNTRVTGKIDITANVDYAFNVSRSGTALVAAQIFNSNSWILWGAENASGGGIFTGSTAYAAVIGNGYNYALEFGTNSTIRGSFSNAGVFRVNNLSGTGTRMVVADASGNLSTQTIPSGSSGTVTSVALAVNSTGTDISVSGSPVTSTGTLTISIPSASGSARGVLTSADWTTFNNKENAITAGTTSQYWRGDKSWQTLNTTAVTEGTNLYYTDARARASKSLTTTGTSGAATYNSTTGVLNIPQYQGVLTNPVTGTGTTNALAKFTGTSTIGSSNITDTGSAISMGGTITMTNLAGSGTRMVVADANGLLSTQTIPSGGGGGTGTVTSVGLTTGTSGNDVNVSGSPITSSGTITLNIPDASATARGLVNTGTQTFAGDKTFTGQTTLNVTRTSITNGSYGMYMLTTYNLAAGDSNKNVYTSVDALKLNFNAGALSGNASYNVTANLNQVSIEGNASTISTQPIRGIISGILGAPGGTAMNIADYRYFDAKSPDNAAISGHIVTSMFGLRIGQLKGATGFTITNGWGVYQEGSQDNNYFAGSVVIGSTTVGSYKLDITNNLRVNTAQGSSIAIESFVNSAASGSALPSVYSTASGSSIVFGSQANSSYLVGDYVFIGNQSAKFMVAGDNLSGAYDGWGTIGSSTKYLSAGFFNNLTVKTQLIYNQVFVRKTASYTLALGDQCDVIEMNVASANTVTVPTNATAAFSIGTQVTVTQYGAGQTTIAAASGVTLRSTNNWLKISAQYGSATLVKVATDEWYVIGNLSA